MRLFAVRRAFTLIEMIAVLTLLLVIAALAVPSFQSVIDQGRANSAVATAKALATSVTAYAASQGRAVPQDEDFSKVLDRVTQDDINDPTSAYYGRTDLEGWMKASWMSQIGDWTGGQIPNVENAPANAGELSRYMESNGGDTLVRLNFLSIWIENGTVQRNEFVILAGTSWQHFKYACGTWNGTSYTIKSVPNAAVPQNGFGDPSWVGCANL